MLTCPGRVYIGPETAPVHTLYPAHKHPALYMYTHYLPLSTTGDIHKRSITHTYNISGYTMHGIYENALVNLVQLWAGFSMTAMTAHDGIVSHFTIPNP